jgi:hypothetical protein
MRIPTDICALAGVPTKDVMNSKTEDNKVVLMKFLISVDSSPEDDLMVLVTEG